MVGFVFADRRHRRPDTALRLRGHGFVARADAASRVVAALVDAEALAAWLLAEGMRGGFDYLAP